MSSRNEAGRPLEGGLLPGAGGTPVKYLRFSRTRGDSQQPTHKLRAGENSESMRGVSGLQNKTAGEVSDSLSGSSWYPLGLNRDYSVLVRWRSSPTATSPDPSSIKVMGSGTSLPALP